MKGKGRIDATSPWLQSMFVVCHFMQQMHVCSVISSRDGCKSSAATTVYPLEGKYNSLYLVRCDENGQKYALI